VTAEELAELMDELGSVIKRFAERLGEEPSPGAQRVSVQLYATPINPEERP
jgi:hypothetical protein